ncbi:outer membrane beta-barrel protein [uncultured Lacinutrix sp.]|uniref:outer membrane beta-barrel protein n=1 Tax=uncultured Lacinutrix sp. TaxID=574032 RepID=UPI0026367B82|nr:outer membrane beta-barrel protein [uncultured Lacinutrix sp.]
MKKITLIIVLLITSIGFAQDAEEKAVKKFSFEGSVDTYFRTNLTATDTIAQSPASFANQTGFALGMANVIGSYESENVGAVADLVFGPRGEQAVGSDVLYVNQLYAYWNVSEKTKLTLGRFNTFLGYEVISPVGNFNYSTSYLFASGPFSHVGLKADFELSEDFSLMLSAMNATDTNNNITGDYAFGAQLGYSDQYLNVYYDSGVVLGFEVDFTGGFDVSDEMFLGINAAYQDNDGSGFYGAALYPQYSLNDAFSLGLRGEYFALHGEGDDLPSVFDVTLTGSYVVDDLTIKPEIRFDSWSDNTPFYDADGLPTESLASFLVAAIYKF